MVPFLQRTANNAARSHPAGRWLRRLATLLIILCLAAAGAVLVLPAESPEAFAADPSAWHATGPFRPVDPSPDFVRSDSRAELYWSAKFAGRPEVGQLTSPAFDAPPVVSLLVQGDLTGFSGALGIERLDGGEKIRIAVLGNPIAWRPVVRCLPPSWWGKPVRLVAVARLASQLDSFGVSNLHGLSALDLIQRQLRPVFLLPLWLACAAIFLAPGLVGALGFVRRAQLHPGAAVGAAVVLSCLLAYLVFWAYFASPRLGAVCGVVLAGCGVAACGVLASGRWPFRATLAKADVSSPLLLFAVVGLFDQALLHSVDLGLPPTAQPRMRFLEYNLPGDNDLPDVFATRLANGDDPRVLWGDEHSSDRPPLQAAVVLGQRAAAGLVGVPLVQHYQTLGSVLQCAWVPAVWALCRLGGLGRPRTRIVVVLIALGGFTVVNSVYVWPKMLAGGLAVYASALALWPRVTGRRWMWALLTGAAAALALLAHGTAAFTLIPLAVVLMTRVRMHGATALLTAAMVGAALMVPWSAYTVYFDPPGNRLLKYHLAGAPQRDPRTTWEAIRAAYDVIGFKGAVANKAMNVWVLLFENPSALYFGYPHDANTPLAWADWKGLRRREFHNLFFGLGSLNLGWLIICAGKLNPRARELVHVLLGLAGLNLLLWLVLMFGPGTTVLHHGSYACILLFAAALAASVTSVRITYTRLILALQVTDLALVWLLTSPAHAFGLPNPGMIVAALGCALSFLGLAWIGGPNRLRTGFFGWKARQR